MRVVTEAGGAPNTFENFLAGVAPGRGVGNHSPSRGNLPIVVRILEHLNQIDIYFDKSLVLHILLFFYLRDQAATPPRVPSPLCLLYQCLVT